MAACSCWCGGKCPEPLKRWDDMAGCTRPAKYVITFDPGAFPISSKHRMCDECVAMRRANPRRWPMLSIRSLHLDGGMHGTQTLRE